jgi:hypothetical protein
LHASLVVLTACAGNLSDTLSADPTPEAYVAFAGTGATLAPAGQYALDGRNVSCKSLPTVLDPHLDDYAASFPKLIVVRPDMMAKPPTAVKLWIYYHECGHEFIGPDETKADCYSVTQGVKEGWLDSRGLDDVCNFISAAQQDSTHFAGPQRCLAIRACYAKATQANRPRR